MENTNNQRIAKNTFYLYIRMLITMAVSLYTSRVVLDVLGAEDYGIYGIVGSVVVLFSFLQNAMAGASQRFFSYELGRESSGNIGRVYSVTLITYIFIAIAVLILGETIGLWFLETQLVIPEERMFAANLVYQFSLISLVINIIQIPYNALIISYEKMSIYAYASIIDVILKLGIALLISIASTDKLILYGLLMVVVNLISFSIYFIYCRRSFSQCRFYWVRDKGLLNKLLSFTGWSLCGNMANVAAQQGGNIILNLFFGVLLNTAYGIANQVSGAVYGFVTNFQMAFRPQIVKLYASEEKEAMYQLIYRASRFSFYLLLIIAVPFVINADYVFGLWLKDVPEYSVLFCQLMMFYCLIDSIQAPLWMMIDASGNIKTYSLWLSGILLFNLPLSYFLLKMGCPPETLLIVRVLLNLVTAVIRTLYVKKAFLFPSGEYVKRTIGCVFIGIATFILAYYFKKWIGDIYMDGFSSTVISVLIVSAIVLFVGMKSEERKLLRTLIIKK